jgi:hypothetical protein
MRTRPLLLSRCVQGQPIPPPPPPIISWTIADDAKVASAARSVDALVAGGAAVVIIAAHAGATGLPWPGVAADHSLPQAANDQPPSLTLAAERLQVCAVGGVCVMGTGVGSEL